jgi:hypothetical protein
VHINIAQILLNARPDWNVILVMAVIAYLHNVIVLVIALIPQSIPAEIIKNVK